MNGVNGIALRLVAIGILVYVIYRLVSGWRTEKTG